MKKALKGRERVILMLINILKNVLLAKCLKTEFSCNIKLLLKNKSGLFPVFLPCSYFRWFLDVFLSCPLFSLRWHWQVGFCCCCFCWCCHRCHRCQSLYSSVTCITHSCWDYTSFKLYQDPHRHTGRMTGHQGPILVSRIRTLLDVQSRFMMD